MIYMRNPSARQRQAKTFRTLHTALFALHTPHLHFTLHLTSKHVSSSHLISARLISSHLFSHVIKVSQLFSSHPSTDQPFYLLEVVLNSSQLFCTPESSYCQTDVSCTKKNIGRRKFLHTDTWGTNAFRQKSLSEILCTKLAQSISQHYFVLSKLAQSTSQYYLVLQSLHKALPSTTLYYKSFCTTRLAQSTSQYYFVLLAQSTSQYYFVLQSLHKALPSGTLYYKACTKHFPVLLCTTKLAQNTSQQYFVVHKACTQHYFVLQSLRKALPSTTLYHEACAKRFPVLFCTTKLAQSTPQYYFVKQSLHK